MFLMATGAPLLSTSPPLPAFDRHHVVILPHAEEYRRLYEVRIEEMLTCLNAPDPSEGLADEHYTAEKQRGSTGACVSNSPQGHDLANRQKQPAVV